jgi:hypothetical protein
MTSSISLQMGAKESHMQREARLLREANAAISALEKREAADTTRMEMLERENTRLAEIAAEEYERTQMLERVRELEEEERRKRELLSLEAAQETIRAAQQARVVEEEIMRQRALLSLETSREAEQEAERARALEERSIERERQRDREARRNTELAKLKGFHDGMKAELDLLERQVTTPSPRGTRHDCKGETVRGEPCSNPCTTSSPYCALHTKKELARKRRELSELSMSIDTSMELIG